MLHLSAAALVLVLALTGAARAETAPRSAALTWDAPPGCPTVDQVLDDVERTLVVRRPTPVTAAAFVTKGPDDRWQASLAIQVAGTRTERRFQAESCAAIAAAVALIVAIAVDDAPAVEEAPAADDAAGAVSVPSVPAAPRPAFDGEMPPPLKIQPAAAVSPALRYFVMPSAILDWGTLPSPPALGVGLAAGRKWSVGSWRLGGVLGTEFFPDQPAANAPYLGPVDGSFWMLGLSARGCFAFAFSRIEIGPCLGAELVGMRAVAAPSPFISVQTQTELWLSALGSLALSWSFAPMTELVLRADLVVPTTRKIFGLGDGNLLWDYIVSRAAVRAALGVAYRF